MLINNSFLTADRNFSNSAEFVFGALHLNAFLGGSIPCDEKFWGRELLPLNIYLVLILLAKVSKSRWSWAQSKLIGVGTNEGTFAHKSFRNGDNCDASSVSMIRWWLLLTSYWGSTESLKYPVITLKDFL